MREQLGAFVADKLENVLSYPVGADMIMKGASVADIRVYIAAPFQLQDAAIALREFLEDGGIGCTSSWLEAPENIDDHWARRDLSDVARCDVFVAMNPEDWSSRGTGGRHVEFGYALALRKPVLILGTRTNIFHHLRDVACCAVEDAAEVIREIWMTT